MYRVEKDEKVMARADVAASCVTPLVNTSPWKRRALLGGIVLGVFGLWSFGLRSVPFVPRDAAMASATLMSSDNDLDTPLVETIVIATTPELAEVVRRAGAYLKHENKRVRFVVETVTPEQGFTLLGQGRLLGVVSPRLMTPQEQLTLTAKNHDLMQIPAALDPNVPMRAWAEDNLHPPPKEQHFVFLYMRGEAMMRRPTLQAFSRHFRQVFYDNQRVTMALTEAPNGVLR
jgi:hypothetical protein